MNWISVKDRLPRKDEEVLLYTINKEATLGILTDDICEGLEVISWNTFGGRLYYFNEISHWAPMPPSPVADPSNKLSTGSMETTHKWYKATDKSPKHGSKILVWSGKVGDIPNEVWALMSEWYPSPYQPYWRYIEIDKNGIELPIIMSTTKEKPEPVEKGFRF